MNRIYKRRSTKLNFFYNMSITNWIVLINIIFFIISVLALITYPEFWDYTVLKPSNILDGKSVWTLLTSMFLHAGLGHLFVNMMSLLFIGNFIERIIGRKRFLWFYLISGIVAGLFFVVFSFILKSNLDVAAVGASGAIFGLGGLLAILTPKLPVLVFFVIPMPMWAAMLFLLLFLWFLSLALELPIGNTAHLGGLLVGVIYGIYLRYKYKRKVAILNSYFR